MAKLILLVVGVVAAIYSLNGAIGLVVLAANLNRANGDGFAILQLLALEAIFATVAFYCFRAFRKHPAT